MFQRDTNFTYAYHFRDVFGQQLILNFSHNCNMCCKIQVYLTQKLCNAESLVMSFRIVQLLHDCSIVLRVTQALILYYEIIIS